ncbi:hypothetical protein [Umezawaea beigongshangensis]|uniref:hypothetical protein n=1 Tax=Umezawaea beigongshangensis TaxID=2780383 RepID=UPI0018F10FF2|nr:hypothetical protein [Umezawaea beigongshangensis]
MPKILFQQSLQLSERISDDWARMRSQLVSAAHLEAAHGVIAAELPLDIQLAEDDARQLVALYNQAVIDGRYLNKLTVEPAEVAQALGVEISAAAENGLKRIGELNAVRAANEEAAVPFVGVVAVVGIVVLGVVLVVDPAVRSEVVVDSSGIVKL